VLYSPTLVPDCPAGAGPVLMHEFEGWQIAPFKARPSTPEDYDFNNDALRQVRPQRTATKYCHTVLPQNTAAKCCQKVLPQSTATQCCHTLLPHSVAELCSSKVLPQGPAAKSASKLSAEAHASAVPLARRDVPLLGNVAAQKNR
jgi:hypothetical protein